jgi:hypothetical protein
MTSTAGFTRDTIKKKIEKMCKFFNRIRSYPSKNRNQKLKEKKRIFDY